MSEGPDRGWTLARRYATLRVGIGVLGALSFLEFAPLLDEQFGATSWISGAHTGPIRQGLELPTFAGEMGPASIRILFAMTLGALLAFAAGLRVRISGLLAFAGLAWFEARNPLLFDADDALVRSMLLLLAFTVQGTASTCAAATRFEPLPPRWPLALVRLQVIIVYFTGGFGKVFGKTWRDGSALPEVLANPAYSRFGCRMLALGEPALRALGRTVPWVEMAFALALVFRPTRRYGVWVGAGFQVGLIAFLKLRLFGWTLLLVLWAAFAP